MVFIEDAAQALGAQIDNRMAGTQGEIGIYSLGQGKGLPVGAGGAIVTNHDRGEALPPGRGRTPLREHDRLSGGPPPVRGLYHVAWKRFAKAEVGVVSLDAGDEQALTECKLDLRYDGIGVHVQQLADGPVVFGMLQ